jgi:hypothetical protein
MGIGASAAPSATQVLNIGNAPSALSGGFQYGILAQPTFSSTATSSGAALAVALQTQAASFTMTSGYGLQITGPALGASSAITTLYGINVANQGGAGRTNAYGVDIAAQSGAATTNFALAARSEVVLGTASIANAATTGFVDICSQAGTPTGVPGQVPAGYNAMRYDTTAHKLWVYDAGWKGIVLT